MNFNQTHHTSIEYPASRPTRSIGFGVGGEPVGGVHAGNARIDNVRVENCSVGETAEMIPAAQVIAVITSQNFSDAEAVGIRV